MGYPFPQGFAGSNPARSTKIFLATANLKTKSHLNNTGGNILVYCSKCGTQNPDDARVCSNCGAPLYTVGQPYRGSDQEHYRRVQGECFGLPNGGAIAGLVFGVIIILLGVGLFLQASGYIENFWNIFWPLILVIFGVLVLAGALFGRRRYTEGRRY